MMKRGFILLIVSLFVSFCSIEVLTTSAEEIDEKNYLNHFESWESFVEFYNDPTQTTLIRSSLVMGERIAYWYDGAGIKRYVTKLYIDGELVVCLEPLIAAQSGEGYHENYDYDLIDYATRDYLWSIYYHGYHYEQNNFNLLTVQSMIWQVMMGWGHIDLYWVSNDEWIDYGWKQEQIEYEIRNAQSKVSPSFHNQTMEIATNQYTAIVDETGNLSNWKLQTIPEGMDAYIEGNTLYVKASDSIIKEGWITLEDKSFLEHANMNIVYKKVGSQTVFKASVQDPIGSSKLKVILSLGSIEIRKKNEYGIPLKNVAFLLATDVELKNVVATGITDEQGILSFSSLEDGTYYIKEEATASNHQLNSEIIPVKVIAGTVTIQEIRNKSSLNKIQIIKKDDGSNTEAPQYDQLLNGAIFSVKDQESEQVILTGESGKSYLVIWDDEDASKLAINISVELSQKLDFSSVDIITSITGSIDLTELGLEVGDYYYRVKDSKEVNQFTIQSDYTGIMEVNGLKNGRIYLIEEIQPPKDYALQEGQNYEVLLQEQQERSKNEFLFFNQVEPGTVEVIKLDEYGTIVTEEQKVVLLSNCLETEQSEILSIMSGKLIIDQLSVGKYCLKEVASSKDFELNSTKKELLIQPNETTKITLVNQRKLVRGAIKKIDKELDLIGNEVLLNDTFFSIREVLTNRILLEGKTGNDYLIVWQESNRSLLAINAEVEISETEDFKKVDVVKTNSNGVINLSELGYLQGDYYYRLKNSKQIHSFSLLYTDGVLEYFGLKAGVEYEICETIPSISHQQAKDEICRIIIPEIETQDQIMELYENEIRELTLKVTKRDSVTKSLLNGVVFEFYDTYYASEENPLGYYLGKYMTGGIVVESTVNTKVFIYEEEEYERFVGSELETELIPSRIEETNGSGWLLLQLEEGNYYYRIDETEEYIKRVVEDGVMVVEGVKYGHPIMGKELITAVDYYLLQEEIYFIPKTERETDIYEYVVYNTKKVEIIYTGNQTKVILYGFLLGISSCILTITLSIKNSKKDN